MKAITKNIKGIVSRTWGGLLVVYEIDKMSTILSHHFYFLSHRHILKLKKACSPGISFESARLN
jgi:hypothetical protein